MRPYMNTFRADILKHFSVKTIPGNFGIVRWLGFSNKKNTRKIVGRNKRQSRTIIIIVRPRSDYNIVTSSERVLFRGCGFSEPGPDRTVFRPYARLRGIVLNGFFGTLFEYFNTFEILFTQSILTIITMANIF